MSTARRDVGNQTFRTRRKTLRYSQGQVANLTKLSQADINRIEAAGWTPPAPIQNQLAEVLETTAEELFDNHSDPRLSRPCISNA